MRINLINNATARTMLSSLVGELVRVNTVPVRVTGGI